MKPRLFIVLLIVMSLSFVLRTGNIIAVLVDSEANSEQMVFIGASQAIAEETEEEEAPSEEELERILENSENTQAAVQEQLEETSANSRKPIEDLLAPRFTEEEVEILQNLGERREQLDIMEARLLQKERLLSVTEKKIEEKLVELQTLKTELQELIGQQQNVQEGRLKQLVKIYETMKPKDAARIFNDLQFDILISIVERMSERRIAPILASMDADKARFLSAKLAEQSALPDPNNLIE